MANQAKIISFFRGSRSETISAVVPAFNEEANITTVLELLHRCPDLVQITVVDDGSTDSSARRVLEYARWEPRLRLLRLERNRGKGAAMIPGWSGQRNSARLSGQRNNARWSGQRDSARWSGQRNSARLSGDRCLRWSLFSETPGLAESRYGAEVALNRFARKQGLPVRLVHWPGVTHCSKYEKRGLFRGLLAYLRMYREILRVPLHRVQPDRA